MSRQEQVQRILREAEARVPDNLKGIPCLGCPSSAACADLELACQAFRWWTTFNPRAKRATERDREPSRRMFLLTMGGIDEDA